MNHSITVIFKNKFYCLHVAITLVLFQFMLPECYAQSEPNPTEVTGIAEVIVVDNFNEGQSELRYFLIEQGTNTRFELRFRPEETRRVKTGQSINVIGQLKADKSKLDVKELTFTNDPSAFEHDADQRGPDTEFVVATPETRKILTLVVDFNDAKVFDYDNPSNTPNGMTVQEIEDMMFNEQKNVADFYETASLGAITIPSDPNNLGEAAVYGPFQIDYNYFGVSGQCPDLNEYVEAALEKWETDTGQNRTSYQHHLLITPNWIDYSGADCDTGSIAILGCYPTICWAFSQQPKHLQHNVVIHELGHNLGLHHARTWVGYDMSSTGYCEYCDGSDPMGGGTEEWMKFNAPHVNFMGWYDQLSYEIRNLVPADEPEVFELIPIDEEAADWPGLRAIKVKRDEFSYYFISYRQQAGKYNLVQTEYTTGLNLHWSDTREEEYSDAYSYFDSLLEPGEVFLDAQANLAIQAIGEIQVSENRRVFKLKLCNNNCSILTLLKDGFEGSPN